MSQTSGWRRGTVLAAGMLAVLALVVVVLLATSAGGSGGGYTVRAIFDDAANIISGEVVKIGGVKVGVVGSVTPTPQQKAAVVLKIEDPGFQDFREDASCTIEPQALIGEKFVNCLPTQPRAEGTPLPPPLHQIPAGHEGEGQYLLPVTNTSSPIDVDLLEDINRLPVRQRFTIIINELGAGLASRGSDLNAVIRRADPALRELDKVLSILASQNKLLANLADESSRALAPVAGVKEDISNFIVSSDTVARASANQRGAIAQNLAAFPAFLRQFGPAMERFGRFAEQTIPTFTDLKAAAPGINQTFTSLAPFSRSSTTFFQSLGKSAKVSGPALVALQPLLAKVKTLGSAAKPFSASLAELFTSLRDTGGLERFMDLIFLGAGTTNGYDALGHFLRTEGVAAVLCLTYAITPHSGCHGKLFNSTGSSSSSGASSATAHSADAASSSAAQSATVARVEHAAGTSLLMARTLAVIEGATPAQAIAKFPGSVSTGETLPGSELTGEGSAKSGPVGGSSSGTTYYTPSEESSGAGGMLLNYLLGSG
ncbi:MAG TPA: MlaD family protein [Solirubrobacteraceae bacterium]|nr:MlaD family protein [Solirubrobacteraceae bacterium]